MTPSPLTNKNGTVRLVVCKGKKQQMLVLSGHYNLANSVTITSQNLYMPSRELFLNSKT